MIIYFSKINLESTELLEMYKKEEMFDTMRKLQKKADSSK